MGGPHDIASSRSRGSARAGASERGYGIEQELGSGRWYLVEQARTIAGQPVVIKSLRDIDDVRARARLGCEIACLAALDHPNLARLVDVIDDERGPVALVTEFVPGSTLAQLVEAGAMAWPRVVELLAQLVEALSAVHAAGYVHRDLSASNVLVEGLDAERLAVRVVIIDFGLAERIAPEHALAPNTRELSGTPATMAPERIEGQRSGEPSDLYSLAVLGFELLAGRPPFVASTAVEVLRDHVHRPAPRVDQVHPRVVAPPKLLQWIDRGLAKDPASRPTLPQTRALLEQLRAPRERLDGAEVERLELRALAERVRDAWIAGVLEASTTGLTMIPQARRLTTNASGDSEPILASLGLDSIFARCHRRMRITGPAGQGKTLQMLRLARSLLDANLQQPERAVPVIFNMSAWSVRYPRLEEFLVHELGSKYGVVPGQARAWLERGRVLPMLDALDEVAVEQQEAACAALRAYLDQSSKPALVLTHRTNSLAGEGELPLDSLELMDLRSEDTARFLRGDWHRLRDALAHDPELEQLSRTPWLLQIMRVSVDDPEFLTDERRRAGSPHRWLVGRYVDAVLGGPRSARVPVPERLRRELHDFARMLSIHDQSMLVIEELQPSTLARASSRRLYAWLSRLASASMLTAAAVPTIVFSPLDNQGFVPTTEFAIALAVGMALVLTVGLVLWARVDTDRRRSWVAISMWGALLGLLVAAGLWSIGHRHPVVWVFGMNAGLIGALVLGGGRRDRAFPERDIETVESLRWEPRRVTRRVWARLVLAAILVFVGLGMVESMHAGFVVAALLAVMGSAIASSRAVRLERRLTPNLGIQRSIRSALQAACLGGLLAALLLAALYGIHYALIGAGFVGVIAGLWFGGVDSCNHYVLRGLLALEGSLPLRPSRRLDAGVHLGLLRRVGNGYMFAHSSLREYFSGTE